MQRRRLLTGAVAALLVAAQGMADAGDNFHYQQYCIACHGGDARGVASLGVDLAGSRFVATASEQELVEFIKVGRSADDPQSQTNRPMPGFDWVPEQELQSVAAWLKAEAPK
jgi:mono/diheme cytochrome c family protein